MIDDSGDPAGTTRGRRWLGAVLEVLAITAIFAAAGAWPTPDSNEAAYLTKARHAADPTWGAGDFYLETPDAHGVFYLVVGPLAARLPLDTTAWIGRIAGWIALAVGFRHLAMATVTGSEWSPTLRAWARLVAAALFSLAVRQTTAAGEWVIGGCEAKVFAWALVFGGLGEVARGRFAIAWCLLGGATAFHPLVGGWSMVAATGAAVCQRPWASRPHSWSCTAGLAIAGVLLAAGGVVPALLLNAGADAATKEAAASIYVVERLPHHLLVQTFATGLVARHLLAAALWWLLRGMIQESPARRRLDAFTLAALGISLAGVLMTLAEPWAPAAAHGLLRYYWFRLGDIAVPLALAITAAVVLADDAACRRIVSLSPRRLRALVTVLLLVDLAAESRHWPLPGRELMARADSKVDSPAWVDVCDWVREHAASGACVLTPRGSATLTWRTGFPEVVAWKNCPQDAASLVAWRKRIIDCFSIDGTMENSVRSTATLGPERVAEVAARYGATLAIVPLESVGIDELPYRRLYANEVYAVFDLAK